MLRQSEQERALKLGAQTIRQEMDVVLIEQVVFNLVRNAFDALQEGGAATHRDAVERARR